MRDKGGIRGQVTIFIIIAIILVAVVAGFFVFRGKISVGGIPKNLEPVYTTFLTCLEEDTSSGINILGSQGGYIEKPVFEIGSPFAPSSSQLDFLGLGVPYWYYVSENNIQKEQIPSLSDMEEQLGKYIEENVQECSFAEHYDEGFEIAIGEPGAKVDIQEKKVDVSLNVEFVVRNGEEVAVIRNHNVEIKSSLGNFYDSAKKIYSEQKKNNFLGDYGVDVLRLYAPVDGVELTCSPLTWTQSKIKTDLRDALEANIRTIKLKGNYYSINKEQEYFVHDIGKTMSDNVNFIYSSYWPTKIEVYPDEEPMIAEPVGNQPGLGVLGFCYVPYHFVYDLTYPVLVQIFDEQELFQFPVAVVINKNLAVKGEVGEEVNDAEPELCKYKVQNLNVYTYNTGLEPVEADISFECLGQRCGIGKTKLEQESAKLSEQFPQCYNGYIVAKSEDYSQKRYLYSTNIRGDVDIILDRAYNVEISLKVDGRDTGDKAIINFASEENSKTILWPEQKSVKLSEGAYNISVYVYSNSKMTIPEMKEERCSEVPKQGLLGILGATEEKCINIDIPGQELESIISGGGKGSEYFVESQLENGKMKIDVNSIALPKSLEGLQDAYNLLEVNPVYVEFN